MSPSPLDSAARIVLTHYPPSCRPGTLVSLGNGGGFSGASLWRIDNAAGSWCLRAWPAHETWPRLRFRHELMTTARQHGLHFVPAVLPARDGDSRVANAGRLWEMTEWLPGRADFHEAPNRIRLESACAALAQLHTVWRGASQNIGECPAVRRRLDFLDEWRRLLRSGWHPLAAAGRDDPLFSLVERAWQLLPAALEAVPVKLRRWSGVKGCLQPCLCDLRHDHLLFVGDRLRGIIDYGAVKIDRVAVDLARMLGSLLGDDAAGWETALRTYRRFTPLDADEEELAHVLDETGTVLGVANWLRWLYEERRSFADLSAVARRLTELMDRLETVQP